jgi:hypothetical protein
MFRSYDHLQEEIYLSEIILVKTLEIQRCGFYSRHSHIFWEGVGLKRGPLSRLRKTEELLLMIPHCLDNQLMDGSKVVRPTH